MSLLSANKNTFLYLSYLQLLSKTISKTLMLRLANYAFTYFIHRAILVQGTRRIWMESANMGYGNNRENQEKMVHAGLNCLCVARDILLVLQLGSQARALGKATLFLQGINQRCSPRLPCTSTATAPCSIAPL